MYVGLEFAGDWQGGVGSCSFPVVELSVVGLDDSSLPFLAEIVLALMLYGRLYELCIKYEGITCTNAPFK